MKKNTNGVLTMNKIVIISLLVLLMSFSGNVLAHCGDAEAHAAASHEHIEKDNANEGDEKKEKKSYKNNINNIIKIYNYLIYHHFKYIKKNIKKSIKKIK